MRWSHLTLRYSILGCAIFLYGAALLLPPLDSHAPVNPVLKMALFVSGAVVLVAMTVGAVSYFVEAWQR